MMRKILVYGLICVVVAVGAVAIIAGIGRDDFAPLSANPVRTEPLRQRPAFLDKNVETLETEIEEAITADLPAITELQAKRQWSSDQGPLIPNGKDAVTSKAVLEELVDYRMRVVKSYREGTRDPEIARAPSIAFLESYSQAAARQRGDYKAICELGDVAIKAGSVDPIVVACHTRARHNLQKIEPLQAADVYNKVKAQTVEGAYPPPVVRFLVSGWIADLAQKVNLPDAPGPYMRRVAFEDAAKFLAKESGSANPAVLLSLVKNHLLFDQQSAEQRLELFQACLMEQRIDPYIIHMLGGEYYRGLAWDHRGSGYANTVSKEGWAKFGELMPRAARHLRRAWFLHPELPFAAERMIMVATAGGDESWSPEQWFHASVTAQLDYHEAYDSYMFVSMPRWGGSHQVVADIARDCIATGRWDTSVPTEAETATGMIAMDGRANAPAGKNPAAAEIAAAYIDAFSAAKERGEVKPEDFPRPLAHMTALLVQSGDFKKAREAFEIGPEPNDWWWGIERGVGYRYSLGLSYAMTGPAEKIVATIHEFLTQEAVEAPLVADVEEMQKRLDDSRALDSEPKAAGFYDIAGRMLEQLKTYAAGEWVDLTFDRQMTLWTSRAASYDVIDPVTLRLTGSEGVPYMQLKPLTRFAPPYMVEAEIKPVSALRGEMQPGIIIGAGSWRDAMQTPLPQQLSAGSKIMGFFSYRQRKGLPSAVDFPLDSVPDDGFQHLGIRRYPGETQLFAMHGRFVADRQPDEPINDFIMFGDTQHSGVTKEAIFRNLRIRRAPPKVSGLDTESPESLPALHEAVNYYPECPEARKHLAGALSEQGRSAEALEHLEKAKAVYHKIVDLERIEGVARCGVGEFEPALAAFRKDYELFPGAIWSRMHEVWILATAPDDKVRNGRKAQELLESLRPQMGERVGIWSFRMTEAAVAAENGRFDEAREFARLGEEAADSNYRREIAVRVRSVLEYNRPYRMSEMGEIPPPPASLKRAKKTVPPVDAETPPPSPSPDAV